MTLATGGRHQFDAKGTKGRKTPLCLAGSKPMFSVGVCDRFAARASQGSVRLFNLEYLSDEGRIPKKGPAALVGPGEKE